MDYKYIEKQVECAKKLAEKYPHIQTHQVIYREHVEVLEKAKAFDKVTKLYEEKEEMYSNEFLEKLGYILKDYSGQTEKYAVSKEGSLVENVDLRGGTKQGAYWASYTPDDEATEINTWITDDINKAKGVALLIDGEVIEWEDK